MSVTARLLPWETGTTWPRLSQCRGFENSEISIDDANRCLWNREDAQRRCRQRSPSTKSPVWKILGRPQTNVEHEMRSRSHPRSSSAHSSTRKLFTVRRVCTHSLQSAKKQVCVLFAVGDEQHAELIFLATREESSMCRFSNAVDCLRRAARHGRDSIYGAMHIRSHKIHSTRPDTAQARHDTRL